MKILLVLPLLCLAAFARADGDNLLQNGDFSSGTAHWVGNCESIKADSSGAMVKLGPAWSKLTQNFNGKPGDYDLTVKYTLMPDLKFSTNGMDYGKSVPTVLGLANVGAFGSRMGQWIVIVFNNTNSTFWRITPSRGSLPQTFTCKIHLDTDIDQEGQTLVLAYPPGTGSVNLQNISFTPTASGVTH